MHNYWKFGRWFRFTSLTLAVFFIPTFAEQCQNKTVVNPRINDAHEIPRFYDCPLPKSDRENTLCCESPNYCCKKPAKFYEIDQELGIIIAVAVVLVALIVTIVLVICCCWEKCPLYMFCRKEAKPDYIAHPDEVMALSPMPTENAAELKTYDPNRAAVV